MCMNLRRPCAARALNLMYAPMCAAQCRTSVPLDEGLGEQRILAKVVALFQDLVNELQALVEFLHHASSSA